MGSTWKPGEMRSTGPFSRMLLVFSHMVRMKETGGLFPLGSSLLHPAITSSPSGQKHSPLRHMPFIVTPLSSLEVTVIRSGTNFLSHSKQTVSSASGFLFKPSPAWIRFPVNNCPRANPEFSDPPHLQGPCFLSASHHPLSCQ